MTWQPADRYPDPPVQILDPGLPATACPLASVERLATGCRWAEGPVWFGDARCLIWSDIPNDRMLRWDEETGAVTTYRRPSRHANGNTRDRSGRLITCEHSGRRVTRTEYDGTITVLCDSYQGRRLNSPNDVVVASDGGMWFTDPSFGLLTHYEGEPSEQELPHATYRLDPATGRPTIVADEILAPNGLAFSPDERLLYIVESRADPRRILRVRCGRGRQRCRAGGC